MRRAIPALLLALLCAGSTNAELRGREFGATATSQTFTINTRALVVSNDGSNEIYIRVFAEGETVGDAVANSTTAQIKANESWKYDQTFNIAAVSIVCAAAETATVRLQYW